jgi:hypothetical protein
MDGAQAPPPQPPPQIKHTELTSSNRGKDAPEYAPRLNNATSDNRSPAMMMRSLGFCPTKHMTPLQFLIAVMNDELDMVFKNEKKKEQTRSKGGIAMSYRVECAKTAAKYMHMEMPKVEVREEGTGFGEALMRAASAGDERVRKRTMIIEQIERISPDVPLPDANYPPMYGQNNSVVLDEDGMIEGEVLNPDGDKDYNPDAE